VHSWEDAYLIEKATGHRHEVGSHYGDPACGLIGPDETWCLTGGEGLVYFGLEHGIREFLRPDHPPDCPGQKYSAVVSLRLESISTVLVELEASNPLGSPWRFDAQSLSLEKVTDRPYNLYDKSS
jgi:hypothetical protein